MQKRKVVHQTPISDFESSYPFTTGRVYRSGMLSFFDFINGERIRGYKAVQSDLPKYEKFAREYLLDKKRDYSGDLIRYSKKLNDEKTPPKTAGWRIVVVKEFLSRNGIVLDSLALKDVRRLKPKGGRRTNFEYIDKKTIGEILPHVKARGKAFILVMASSGCRIGEVLNIHWDDIKTPDRNKYPNKPTSVFIRTSKTGHTRTTYISREAEDAIEAWKLEYPKYVDGATKRSENLKSPGRIKIPRAELLFPFTKSAAYMMWDGALKMAGKYNQDSGTRRLQMNLHRLRNFFSVQVSAINPQVAELLLGHTDQYGGAYARRSQEEMEEIYIRAETGLTIGSTSAQMEATSREVSELRKQLDAMRADMADYKNTVLKSVMAGHRYEKVDDGLMVMRRPSREETLSDVGLEIPEDWASVEMTEKEWLEYLEEEKELQKSYPKLKEFREKNSAPWNQ